MGFLTRKRSLRWLVVGVVLVALGHYLEAQKFEPQSFLRQGQVLTSGLHNRLAALQPGAIADLYRRAGAGRHGIGWCGPTAAATPLTLGPAPHLQRSLPAPAPTAVVPAPPPPSVSWPSSSATLDDPIANIMDPLEREAGMARPRTRPDLSALLAESAQRLPPTPADRLRGQLDPLGTLAGARRLGDPPDLAAAAAALTKATAPPAAPAHCTGGIPAMLDAAALNLRITPEIAFVVWKEGGWSATILLVLTLALIATLIVTVWNQKDIGCAAVPVTLALLGAGPLIAQGVFWVMLQLLLGLTLALGQVLAGLALLLAWLASVSKLAMLMIETLSKSDEAEENFGSLKASLGMEAPKAD